MGEVDMSQALTPAIPEMPTVTNPLESVAKAAVSNAWVSEANTSAVQLAKENTTGESLRTNLAMLGERLNKLNPTSKVLEKALKPLKRSAAKFDRKANWQETWQGMAETKAGRLTAKAVSQAEKANLLQSKMDTRIAKKDVIQNANQFSQQEADRIFAETGMKVDIAAKDKEGNAFTRWFDRTITDRIDKMRRSHNEKLASWNSKRSEGQIVKAIGYQEAATTLRNQAEALKAEMEASRQRFADSIKARRGLLDQLQSENANALELSSDRATVANRRLHYARGDMASLGTTTAESLDGVTDLATATDTTSTFVAEATEGLANAATQGNK